MDVAENYANASPDNIINLLAEIVQEQRRNNQYLHEWRNKTDEKLDALYVEINKMHTRLATKTVTRDEIMEIARNVERHQIMLTGIDESNGLRSEVTALRQKVENMEDEDNRKYGQNKIYQRVLLWVSGVGATISAAFLMNYFMK